MESSLLVNAVDGEKRVRLLARMAMQQMMYSSWKLASTARFAPTTMSCSGAAHVWSWTVASLLLIFWSNTLAGSTLDKTLSVNSLNKVLLICKTSSRRVCGAVEPEPQTSPLEFRPHHSKSWHVANAMNTSRKRAHAKAWHGALPNYVTSVAINVVYLLVSEMMLLIDACAE